MKRTSEPKPNTGSDAWGRDNTTMVHTEEVEACDVNRVREHYRGMNHASYQFRAADVGRTLSVLTAPGYTSWVFAA